MTDHSPSKLDPVLTRLGEDIAAGDFLSRYDPVGDVLTVIFARPDSPVTSHDRGDGVYIDFDPDEGRITALTIVNYRADFTGRYSSAPPPGIFAKVRMLALLLLDRAASPFGIDLQQQWRRMIGGERLRDALGNYRGILQREPQRLAGLVDIPASA